MGFKTVFNRIGSTDVDKVESKLRRIASGKCPRCKKRKSVKPFRLCACCKRRMYG